MLLPVMGFFLMLIVVGGLGSLVAAADPMRARLFPFTLALLFSGAGVYILALGLGYVGQILFDQSETISSLAFLAGLVVGSLGGAILGFVIGIRRNGRIAKWRRMGNQDLEE